MRRYIEWDSPWMADKSLAGGGALLNLGGHGFDMARFVTGEEPGRPMDGATLPQSRPPSAPTPSA